MWKLQIRARPIHPPESTDKYVKKKKKKKNVSLSIYLDHKSKGHVSRLL